MKAKQLKSIFNALEDNADVTFVYAWEAEHFLEQAGVIKEDLPFYIVECRQKNGTSGEFEELEIRLTL